MSRAFLAFALVVVAGCGSGTSADDGSTSGGATIPIGGGNGGASGKSGAGGAQAGVGGASTGGTSAGGASTGGTSHGGTSAGGASTGGSSSSGSGGAKAGSGGTNASGAAGSSNAGASGSSGANGGASGAHGGTSGGSGGTSSGGSGGGSVCNEGAVQACGTCNLGMQTCTNDAWGPCTDPPAPSQLSLDATIRDFHMSTVGMANYGHPDFENAEGDDPGIVTMMLGSDQKPVYAPGATGTTPTTHGQMWFDMWYRDTAMWNDPAPLPLSLSLVAGSNPPTYSYSNDAFFPIDGMLFGNEGEPHNYSFTVELHTQFTYRGGETFYFRGDDDLWVFINNQLAINLGGVHGAEDSMVMLDSAAATLGLSQCGTYSLDLFFAERHTVASEFRVDTSIVLEKP